LLPCGAGEKRAHGGDDGGALAPRSRARNGGGSIDGSGSGSGGSSHDADSSSSEAGSGGSGGGGGGSGAMRISLGRRPLDHAIGVVAEHWAIKVGDVWYEVGVNAAARVDGTKNVVRRTSDDGVFPTIQVLGDTPRCGAVEAWMALACCAPQLRDYGRELPDVRA
jgi:hypothetical protein